MNAWDALPALVEILGASQAGRVILSSTCPRLQDHLKIIRRCGGSAGVVIDSEAALDRVLPLLDLVDHVELRIQCPNLNSTLDLTGALIAIDVIQKNGGKHVEIAAASVRRSDVALLAAKGVSSFIVPASVPGRIVEEVRTAAVGAQEGIYASKELSSHTSTFGVCFRMELGKTFSNLMLAAVSNMVSSRQGRILLSRPNQVFALVTDVSPEYFSMTASCELEAQSDEFRGCSVDINPNPNRFRRNLFERVF